MILKTGLIEFGERDWDRWIFQINHPVIRYAPKVGFGLAAQKAIKKPVDQDATNE